MVSFSHSRVDEHGGRDQAEDGAEVLPRDYHTSATGKRLRDSAELICADRLDTVQGSPAIEECVGECHPTTRRVRLDGLVNDDSVAGAEKAMRDSGPDVAGAPDQTGHHLTAYQSRERGFPSCRRLLDAGV